LNGRRLFLVAAMTARITAVPVRTIPATADPNVIAGVLGGVVGDVRLVVVATELLVLVLLVLEMVDAVRWMTSWYL